MAEEEDIFDDLDAFFSAASNANPDQLQQAAENVAIGPSPAAEPTRQAHPDAGTAHPSARPEDLEGKFIAIDPEALGLEPSDDEREPFIIIPAHIHTLLPWWGWTTIGLGLLVLVAGVMIAPYINLSRLASRLGDSNEANAQYAMRQLVLRGDERTVGKLYDLAASDNEPMAARLRAVDTLGLIEDSQADRALQRLELAGSTHRQIRDAAIATRKQRAASRGRGKR